MNSSSVIKNISVIVAYRNSGGHLLDMFIDLKLWFSDITIVGSNSSNNSQKIKFYKGEPLSINKIDKHEHVVDLEIIDEKEEELKAK